MAFDIHILKRFFDGKYSRKDYIAIREKLISEKDDHEIRELMLSHWVEFGSIRLPDENLDHILDKIQHRVRLEEIKDARRYRFINGFKRVAAILIFPMLLSFLAYLYFQPHSESQSVSYAEIQCPMGARIKFILPDGTTGFLNSGSTLNYPVFFGKSRQVELTGEAYFDVVSDEKSPFTIKTRKLNVVVVGTTLNVISYPDEVTEEIILQSGRVEVNDITGKPITELKPDQKLTVNHEARTAFRTKVVSSQYTSWTEGKLVFRNELMEHVAQRLGRWYNAEIILADDQLKKYSFHATFIDEQLDEVLKMLALTTPIAYEEVKREVSADGTYQKRRIILKLNTKKIGQFK